MLQQKETIQSSLPWEGHLAQTGLRKSSVSKVFLFLDCPNTCLFDCSEAEDQIKKLQLKISKQKKEEKRLRSQINQVYGGDEEALDKQQKMNSLYDEIAILQKKFNEAKAEEKDIKTY